jgi:integrase
VASIRPYRTTSGGDRRHEVRFRDGDGSERSRSFSAHRDAQAFKLDIERRRQAGALYIARAEPFAVVAADWLRRFEHGAAGRVRPREASVASVRESLACLAPLSGQYVEQIRRPQVEDLVASIAETRPRRAQLTLALLKRVLKNAEQRGQVVDRGVYDVRVAAPDERDPILLTWEQLDDLRSWMPEYISRLVPIAALTLCRQGELLALRDTDVDFEGDAIMVTGQAKGVGRAPTKTAAGRRTVDIGPFAVRLLREQQLARHSNPTGLLFPSPLGHPFDRNLYMRRVFKPAARAAGFPALTFHDLRHTGASLMIAAGCHVKVIAEQMGHSDGGALVLKRYGHLYKGARRQAALALESHVLTAPRKPTVGSLWDGQQQLWDSR